ncbi:MAG: hypothetical protein P8Q37_07490 [Porticoccaceae bacterium]|nr:hypothetical protein [Porticoccaceae bacterium]MDG1474733.1 hypothetical protein [Porticoccaceae bacterium]
MTKPSSKRLLKRRSTWIATMVACLIFIVMAVQVYQIPVPLMLTNLLNMLLGLGIIIGLSAALGWLLAYLRKRP